MSVRVQWSGLDEFLRDLGSIPRELHDDGMTIIHEETEGAAQELRNAYGVSVTGTLQRRVRTFFPSASILVGIVRSMAPHSHLWHWGTKVRRTLKGYNRGRMPAARPEPMVPIARRRRGRMSRRMVEMLRAKGFQVGNE